MNYKKYKLLPLLLLLFIGFNATSATEAGREFVKEINKSFPISADGRVELANQYGRINIRPWNRNEVKIDVRIVVQASDEDDANEVFERVHIDFYDTGSLVKAKTELTSNNKSSSWWSWLMNGGNNSTEFKIYYEVQMPRTVALQTDAKYCDVNAEDLNGETEFNVKYGNLNLGNLNNSTEMNIGYGEVDVKNISGDALVDIAYGEFDAEDVGNLKMEARYSEVKLEKARNVDLDCRYTEVDLGDVEEIEIDAGYGDVEIASATSVRINSRYTGYEIGPVRKWVDIDTDYGNVEVGPLAPGFTKARLKGGYSSMTIIVDSKASYRLKANTSYAGIDHPSDLDITLSDKSGSSRRIEGKKTGSGQVGDIDVESRYGNVEIRKY